ncbi:ABC transporter ATP-binding protein [Paenibacillus massiliensis]|uniref:ABC transporter ATP-binding protein n=1 Tax=Paenibacillus massiliensis TaxID=225917 RepID=UPI00046F3A04|nr:ABC transporter ATP-binding protein [Paenibacillus massiliensis]
MKIEVINFSKTVGGNKILEDVNVCLSSGNVYGIVGKNGSGKTMFLRMIAGLILPTSGEVKVDGKILGKDISFPDHLGILLEKPSFLPYSTGFENLQMLAKIRNITSNEQIQTLMDLFDLDWKSRKKFKEYSLGMKQKLGIIQAIMENQELIILDEPFNALDENSVRILRTVLEKLKAEGKLIVMTSHNKEDIHLLCDYTFNIIDGKVRGVKEKERNSDDKVKNKPNL